MTVPRSIHVSTNDLNNLIPFYGWVIVHYIHGPHLLYPFTCRWTFRLLLCPGYCKQCCNERWGYICISLSHGHQHGKRQILERVWRKGNPPTLSVKIAQSHPPLCDPMDYIVHGILQARILEWVAVPFSRGSSQPRDWTQVSYIAGRFFTNWATREAQEYWSG